MKSVLFLCTDNASRGQMAEAILRRYAGDKLTVMSAGLRPNEVHPLTRRAMAEVGIDISGQRTKGIKGFLGRVPVSVAIILCDGSEPDCPKFYLDTLVTLRWPMADPAAVAGEVEQLAAFREVRNQLDDRIRAWLEEGGFMIEPTVRNRHDHGHDP